MFGDGHLSHLKTLCWNLQKVVTLVTTRNEITLKRVRKSGLPMNSPVSTAIALVFLASASGFASMKLVTPTGDSVLLKDDKTWDWIQSEPDSNRLSENTTPETAKKTVKSKKLKCTFSYDDAFWKADRHMFGDKEIDFKSKSGQVFGMVIAEKTYVPIETLLEIAESNAKEASTEVFVTKKEERIVNGRKVHMMIMNSIIQNYSFTYIGYYYSDETFGSLQFLTYTYKSSFDRYQGKMIDLLNGLVIQSE
jgi:hypothetical protein